MAGTTSANFQVIVPLILVHSSNSSLTVTVSSSDTWITSPTAPTAILVPFGIREYSIDPSWWKDVPPTVSTWTVGLEGPKATRTDNTKAKLPETTYTTAASTFAQPAHESVASAERTETSSKDPTLSATSSTSSYPTNSGKFTNSTSATNSTASPSATVSNERQRNGISSGAAAGIGVGAAVIGAIMAILVLFFCRRRKKRRSSRGYAAPVDMRSLPSDDSPPEKSPSTMAMIPLASNSNAVDLVLPPPVENSAIVKMFSTLNTRIKDHALNYFSQNFRIADFRRPSFDGSINALILSGTPLDGSQIDDLLHGPHRPSAVRCLIAWAIISNIDTEEPLLEQSLLPSELLECLLSMHQNKAKQDSALLSKWRHLTGSLLTPSYGSKVMSDNDPRLHNVSKLIRRLDEILDPLADPSQARERLHNLEEIIKLGAQHGYLLLTQPTAWKFEWESHHPQSNRELVVFPELVQVEDDQGRPIHVPHGTMQTVPVG